LPYTLALQRALLGPLSHHEQIALGVTTVLLIGFVTQAWHSVEPAWISVLALGILTATGVLATDGLRMVNWGFVLLFGVLISMTDVFAKAGLDSWLASVVAGGLGGLATTPLLFIAALTLLCFGISLVLRWQAAAPLLTITLAPVASSAGIDPWVVGLVALVSCNGFFLPYQSTVYLALYHGTNGRLFTHRQARPAALAYGVITFLALCASVPVWHAMGLL
jgi:di/tricarboxylate transporter